jgi:hypothetical protein
MVGSRLMQRVAALLRRLLKRLPYTSAESSSGPRSDVPPNEPLSSFVTRTDQINKKSNTIRHTRLIPRRSKNERRRLETSVCRSQSLSEIQIWALCSQHFDHFSQRPAIGRGVGPARAVFEVGLTIEADGIPYPEHANIIGWYDSVNKPDDELKHHWMDQAQRMAASFIYLPRLSS